ncbi:endoribonuclease [Aeromonas phage B614]|nr:endoribonuclease [Aeromonas phage B614]UYD58211.1 endoribonuclease [Aeromonas phage UP87]UYD58574.1 endoribonuclease [Aeromonas phage avDM14-QBC]UYD58788.1 endoribonuclease [Aeromonas phage avDM10-HWA]UYD58908.1 endoribonuclease [Aeromonas phage avDM7-IJDJ]UYD59967.1 endoribonuclease [Aeromonas phage avDM9-HANS]
MNRYKLRRILECEFKEMNARIEKARAKDSHSFHLEYTYHFIDDLILRNICPDYAIKLIRGLESKMEEIDAYMSLPYPPHLHEKREEGVEYRPIRLEITDGNLWIGITPSKIPPSNDYSSSLTCRMAIVNNRRLASNVTTKVIKMEGL